jgi:hypothetical protein
LCLNVLFYKSALLDTFKSMSSLNEVGFEGLLEILSHLLKPIAVLTDKTTRDDDDRLERNYGVTLPRPNWFDAEA